MSRVSAMADGTPTDEMADYYPQFARGGFGLVITEGIYTDTAHSQGYLNQPGLASEDHVDGWRQVTDAMHAAGTPIFAQLMHAGAISQGNSTWRGSDCPIGDRADRSDAGGVRRIGALARAPRDDSRRHRISWLPASRRPQPGHAPPGSMEWKSTAPTAICSTSS